MSLSQSVLIEIRSVNIIRKFGNTIIPYYRRSRNENLIRHEDKTWKLIYSQRANCYIRPNNYEQFMIPFYGSNNQVENTLIGLYFVLPNCCFCPVARKGWDLGSKCKGSTDCKHIVDRKKHDLIMLLGSALCGSNSIGKIILSFVGNRKFIKKPLLCQNISWWDNKCGNKAKFIQDGKNVCKKCFKTNKYRHVLECHCGRKSKIKVNDSFYCGLHFPYEQFKIK